MAVDYDVPVEQMIYVDRTVREHLNGSDKVFNELFNSVPDTIGLKELNSAHEVTIDHFLSDILPKADRLEVFFDNAHKGNLMTLVTGSYETEDSLFHWNNNFSWAYNGDIADSMKERVKSAGGKVDGVLRFSIQWNDDGEFSDSNIDLDAHCYEPKGNHIYFSNMKNKKTLGNLDVDIREPRNRIAVENITWPYLHHMDKGVYEFKVHNYSSAICKEGFSAQIEMNGEIHEFEYRKPIRGRNIVEVASVTLSGINKFVIEPYIKSNKTVSIIWNIETNKFHPVNFVMQSPNYWGEGEHKGNRHIFFIMNQCKNTEPVRTIFNEFLRRDLIQYRKC